MKLHLRRLVEENVVLQIRAPIKLMDNGINSHIKLSHGELEKKAFFMKVSSYYWKY